jgi:hypothetical protein
MSFELLAGWKDREAYGYPHDIRDYVRMPTNTGRDGYLREPVFGGYSALQCLCPEAFEKSPAKISAARMRERLPQALELIEAQELDLYDASVEEIEAAKRNLRNFVECCERFEQQTGTAVEVYASQ